MLYVMSTLSVAPKLGLVTRPGRPRRDKMWNSLGFWNKQWRVKAHFLDVSATKVFRNAGAISL